MNALTALFGTPDDPFLVSGAEGLEEVLDLNRLQLPPDRSAVTNWDEARVSTDNIACTVTGSPGMDAGPRRPS